MTTPITVPIDGLSLKCVPLDEADFKDFAAIYVIICIDLNTGKYKTLDVGQSGQLGTRINNHDREECWKKRCAGDIWVCIYPMPTANFSVEQRLEKEQSLRQRLNPPCGVR
jgi:hypothetical protein